MLEKQKIVTSGIIYNSQKEVLLAKRPVTKKIAPGVYHLPGGHVEFGESVEQALMRELNEEFHLEVSLGEVVRTFSYVINDSHTVGITYTVGIEKIPDEIWFDTNDTESIVWVSEVNLDQYLDSKDHDYITLKKFFSIQ